MNNKNNEKLIKILQITASILMLAMVVLCIYLTNKYNIKVQNIPELSKMITGGTFAVAVGIIIFSVVKSFALVFPPAVVISICGYLMPNFALALLINIISVFLSLTIPYYLGKFTGSSMTEVLKKKYKVIKKIDDFAGANEMKMTFVIKMSGLLPGDLSSLLFGAMNISFKNYFIGANLGMLPLILVYTGFGYALKNVAEAPWLPVIPVAAIIFFVIISSFITKKIIKDTKKNKAN